MKNVAGNMVFVGELMGYCCLGLAKGLFIVAATEIWTGSEGIPMAIYVWFPVAWSISY